MQINKKISGPVIILIMMGFSLAMAQTPLKKSFKIDVTVQQLKKSAKLILTVREVNQWVEYTAESSNGRFTLSGSLSEPSFAYLVMKYGEETTMAPRLGNVSKLYLSYVPMKIVTKDSLNSAVVEGGHLQKELEELESLTSVWKKENKSDADKSAVLSQFIREHPTSFVSLYAVQNFSTNDSFTIDAERVGPLFELISPSLKNTDSWQTVNNDIRIARFTSIGAIAPEFVQKDTTDHDVALSSFRGKYVLVDFWASWCKPCRLENPELVKTFQEYKDKNFTIISVSLDNNRANWLKAIRKDKLAWAHTSDLKFWKNEVALQYGVKTVPQNFLLDPAGKIIGRNIPSKELASWLNERVH